MNANAITDYDRRRPAPSTAPLDRIYNNHEKHREIEK